MAQHGERLKSLTGAKEIVVLVDACHSGAINPTELGFTWKDKGVILITSSRAGQRSYEGGTYVDDQKRAIVLQNGYFTRAIVDGFGGLPDIGRNQGRRATGDGSYAPADSSQDNVITIGEILNYAIEKVGQWSGGQQSPWAPAYDPASEGVLLGVVK